MANCNSFIDIVYSLGNNFCSQQTVTSLSPVSAANTASNGNSTSNGVLGASTGTANQNPSGSRRRCCCASSGNASNSSNSNTSPSSVLSNSNTNTNNTQCGSGVSNGCGCEDCDCSPVAVVQSASYRLCCNESAGTCGLYPADCRNTFWPDYSHPRWLSCNTLYCNQ